MPGAREITTAALNAMNPTDKTVAFTQIKMGLLKVSDLKKEAKVEKIPGHGKSSAFSPYIGKGIDLCLITSEHIQGTLIGNLSFEVILEVEGKQQVILKHSIVRFSEVGS